MSTPTLVQPMTGIIPKWTLEDRLRKAREYAGLEQTDLAKFFEVTRQTIGNYENGRRRPPRPIMIAWSQATGVSLNWLVTGKEETEPPAGLEPAAYALQGNRSAYRLAA